MARYELSEFEWKIIQPLLPNKPRGVPRVDDRSGLARRGSICLSVTGRGPRSTTASIDGGRRASGTG